MKKGIRDRLTKSYNRFVPTCRCQLGSKYDSLGCFHSLGLVDTHDACGVPLGNSFHFLCQVIENLTPPSQTNGKIMSFQLLAIGDCSRVGPSFCEVCDNVVLHLHTDNVWSIVVTKLPRRSIGVDEQR